MMRTLWESRVTADQAGQTVALEYYLLTEECDGMDLYGVEIRMRRGMACESKSRPRLTPQPGSATDLIQKLAALTVTHTTLDEVLRDLL